MPLSPEHKKRSREKILCSAVTLFARYGFENTSIKQIMDDADMTHGAFYAHFSSKSDLYRESILAAVNGSETVRERPEGATDMEWLMKMLEGYLSMAHIEKSDSPCPLASLTTDIAIREPAVRSTYTDVFKGLNTLICQNMKFRKKAERERALALTAMMIGGVAVGRALNDRDVVEALLAACKSNAEILMKPERK